MASILRLAMCQGAGFLAHTISTDARKRIASRPASPNINPTASAAPRGRSATGRVAGDLHLVAALVTMAVLAIAPQVMVRRVAASVKAVELPAPSELARHLSTVALRGIGPAVSGAVPAVGSPTPPEASPPTAPGRRSAARRRPR